MLELNLDLSFFLQGRRSLTLFNACSASEYYIRLGLGPRANPSFKSTSMPRVKDRNPGKSHHTLAMK